MPVDYGLLTPEHTNCRQKLWGKGCGEKNSLLPHKIIFFYSTNPSKTISSPLLLLNSPINSRPPPPSQNHAPHHSAVCPLFASALPSPISTTTLTPLSPQQIPCNNRPTHDQSHVTTPSPPAPLLKGLDKDTAT